MTKTKLSMGVLLLSGLFLFACGGKTPAGTPGAAGTNGQAGTSAQAGTTGQAGTTATNQDAATDKNPATTADGKCVTGAYPRDGACMCLSNVPNVCGDICVDMMLDNDNCGACANKCAATASCNAGKCGPMPATVIPAAAGCTSIHIAVVGPTLYWTDQGHGMVKSAPVAGTPVTMIAMGEAAPTLIEVRGTTVFWQAGMTIRKSTAGAAATTVVTSTDPINGFTASVDGATVYFSALTKVKQVAAAGGAVVDVASEEQLGKPNALALDGTNLVYPCDVNGDVDVVQLAAGKVASCGKEDPDGGALLQVMCTRIARSQGELILGTVVATGNRAYWANGATLHANVSSQGALQVNEQVASTIGTNSVSTMTFSGTNLFFAEFDPDITKKGTGLIEKTPMVKDSTAVAVARGQNGPASIAADATKVYWSTSDCSIMSTTQ
jgi:Stigma-specific protein, Stig1